MKVSADWLKEYIPNDLTINDLSVILTGVGLEVEGIEEAETVKGGLKGIVVGEVLTCQKHPDADRLSLTTVNVGASDALQIVCGAPNVAAGQKVLVALVGATLYPTVGEAFTIKKGKIRGLESNGMICALDELGLGSDHSGIVVLAEDAVVGQAAAKHLNLSSDHILEVNLTPNRSDATSHFGVARDLYAALKVNLKANPTLKFPETKPALVFGNNCPIAVEIADYEACQRYSGLYFEHIKVQESPEWIKKRLIAIGLRPINNVVDITNYVLHELGQPLHAFDASKIGGQKVKIQFLPAGTVFKTLDDQDRKLQGTELMICDGNDQPMCMAGVFGGASSGVNEQTTSIFLESAYFDAKTIRRASMHHGLRTDAAKCFEKGSDPNVTTIALARAAHLLAIYADARLAGDGIDDYPVPVPRKQVKVALGRIQKLIGAEIDHAIILDILAALDIHILETQGDLLTLAIPTNKVDVYREADIIEEILRIYGFDNVPIPNRIVSSAVKSEQPDNFLLKNRIADFLVSNGFNEMMGISLSQSKYFADLIPVPAEELVGINNTSNTTTDIMRPTMVVSGLEALLHNQNRQKTDLRLFEFGKAYRKKSVGDYKEVEHLTLYLTGQVQKESWLNSTAQKVDFYALKNLVLKIFQSLGVQNFQQSNLSDHPYISIGSKLHRGPTNLAEFGLIAPKVAKGFDLKNEIWYAEFNWSAIIKATKNIQTEYQEISKFPMVRRDLALVLDQSVPFAKVEAIAQKVCKKLLVDINLFDVYKNEEQLGKGKKSYATSFLFEDPERTLQDKEIEKMMQVLTSTLEQQLGAIVRK